MEKIYLSCLLLILSACSTNTNSSNYYSEKDFSEYDCSQITYELTKTKSELEQQLANDKNELFLDSALKVAAMTQGYYFTEDENAKLEALKSKKVVLDSLYVKNKCFGD